MGSKTAIIIGGGPGGLTAAFELLTHTNVKPIIFEACDILGGIARTVNHNGNRIDIGGHRFFSKSDRVMSWWQNMMPLQGFPAKDEKALNLSYQGQTRTFVAPPGGPDPEKVDDVMLVRQRLSRIFFLRKFFNYPLSLNYATLAGLGVVRVFKIGTTYMWSRVFQIKPEKSLEDFIINRFGRELYNTFFKSYTEKVWGVPCDKIKPEWGAQRIKGLSITKAVLHAIKKSLKGRDKSVSQKQTETSLIEQFLYPKLGPGQMWEQTARVVQEKGGELHMQHAVVGIQCDGNAVKSVDVKNLVTGEVKTHVADYFFSTMPVKDLINAISPPAPAEVSRIANELVYRDFITVGLLLNKLSIKNQTNLKTVNDIVPDNWIYIQEPDVLVGRLQIFNNWSPYMVKDLNTAWVGLEYFVNEGDELWCKSDGDMAKLGIEELARIGIIDSREVLDSVVIRMPKTYPAYVGSYDQFDTVRNFTDKLENLFLIGRNGMHRYNNQDHSMMTAMVAVENIRDGIRTKDNIWNVNVEQEYHEEKESGK